MQVRSTTRLRWLMLIALLISFAAVQILAGASFHTHSGPGTDACAICHADHLTASLPVAAISDHAPPLTYERARVAECRPFLCAMADAVRGRAPPVA